MVKTIYKGYQPTHSLLIQGLILKLALSEEITYDPVSGHKFSVPI